ncbi:hypothetical protein GCM10018785_06250 [Streptomyces longispororuber]|uniref:Protein-L-isoaspartate O-methyltransferase n=1 Tax=Streptomyces longispororuber TaxID=68230 RepID=A0A919DEP8_9ACTN|nr:hypothetical protein GCM10018785_06250 [Streptomyces longispororuber]
MAYRDQTWVTQVEGQDAADMARPVTGIPTSRATLPSLVVRTAQVAELRPGLKVLEVGTGTGTGYSTALLCHRLAAGNVISIEYDAALAASAAAHLAEAGCTPVLRGGSWLRTGGGGFRSRGRVGGGA